MVANRSLFNLIATDLTANPTWAGELSAAGFNTIETGCFINPSDAGLDVTVPAQYTQWVNGWLPRFQLWAKTSPFNMLALGDDFFSGVTRQNACLTGWGPQAVKQCITQLAATGRCAGIEALDEANFKYPAGPPAQIAQIVALMRSVPGCPPIAFPLGLNNTGGSKTAAIAAWNDPAIADRASLYIVAENFQATFGIPATEQFTMAQWQATWDSALALLPPGLIPYGIMIPFSGPDGVGTNTQYGPYQAQVVSLYMGLGLANGARQFRFYTWDNAAMAAGRVNPGPTAGWGTGTTPAVQPARWQAASAILNLLK
jgi:hypothetical protein